jgi:hypothetical protein
MDPISNTDRLVRLLRQKLEERAKTKASTPSAPATKVRPRGTETVRAITGEFVRAGVDDKQLRRALIEQLLADQFGPALANEAKFQQVIDRVDDIMAADPTIGPLVDRAIRQIRDQVV